MHGSVLFQAFYVLLDTTDDCSFLRSVNYCGLLIGSSCMKHQSYIANAVVFLLLCFCRDSFYVLLCYTIYYVEVPI